MAKVNIVNVSVLDNPSPFLNPFQFEITFEALDNLSEGKICFLSSLSSFHYFDFRSLPSTRKTMYGTSLWTQFDL